MVLIDTRLGHEGIDDGEKTWASPEENEQWRGI